jgi:hypothetical protein
MRKVIHIFISLVLVGCWLVIGVDRGSTETLPTPPQASGGNSSPCAQA